MPFYGLEACSMFQEIENPSKTCPFPFAELPLTSIFILSPFYLPGVSQKLYYEIISSSTVLALLARKGVQPRSGTRLQTPTAGTPGQDHVEHLKFKNYVAGCKTSSVQSALSRKNIIEIHNYALYRKNKNHERKQVFQLNRPAYMENIMAEIRQIQLAAPC